MWHKSWLAISTCIGAAVVGACLTPVRAADQPQLTNTQGIPVRTWTITGQRGSETKTIALNPMFTVPPSSANMPQKLTSVRVDEVTSDNPLFNNATLLLSSGSQGFALAGTIETYYLTLHVNSDDEIYIELSANIPDGSTFPGISQCKLLGGIGQFQGIAGSCNEGARRLFKNIMDAKSLADPGYTLTLAVPERFRISDMGIACGPPPSPNILDQARAHCTQSVGRIQATVIACKPSETNDLVFSEKTFNMFGSILFECR